MMHNAFIGMGANLGDAPRSLAQALARLAQLPHTRSIAVSSLYRSAPVDADGPDYFNAVVHIETALSASEMLRALQAIENAQGRQRPYRNAPRTLDLDVLAFDSLCCATPELILPHPRAHERAFVLRPWLELAPDFVLPNRGALAAFLPLVADQLIECMAPAHEWAEQA